MFRILRISAVVGVMAFLSPTHDGGRRAADLLPGGVSRLKSEIVSRALGGSPPATLGADLTDRAVRIVLDRIAEARPSADTLAATDRSAVPHSDARRASR